MADMMEFMGKAILIQRRARQKRLGISVYPSGEIRVSANKSTSLKIIQNFLEKNRQWLEQSLRQSENLKRRYPQKRIRSGETFPFLGKVFRLELRTGSSLHFQFRGEELEFTCPWQESEWTAEREKLFLSALRKAYRRSAHSYMGARLIHFSEKMGLFPGGLTIRGQTSIWGSCSPTNQISLNFKLMVAPPWVIDYVIIHELCHIQHKNHSPKFWHLVEKYCQDRRQARQWLKDHAFEADFLNKKTELHKQAP